ncbi:MAG: hypothetical protein H6591_07290 [Flavobacteriales bacterium]|nr:hypothetical protein [Flavobacteriales bacterium]
MLLFAALFAAAISLAQDPERLRPIKLINHQDANEVVYTMHEWGDVSIRVDYLGPLCFLRINPDPEAGGEELKVMGMGGEYWLFSDSWPIHRGISVRAPISVWSGVLSFSCKCPADQSAAIMTYEVLE